MPLSLEGVLLAQLSNEEMQMLLTGEEGKTAEMIVRKKDGSQARVNVSSNATHPKDSCRLISLLYVLVLLFWCCCFSVVVSVSVLRVLVSVLCVLVHVHLFHICLRYS